ncbi:MAG TPA: hypothetical protein VGA52_10285 [Anaerolineales bacterium]|jgi:hypothetical protein
MTQDLPLIGRVTRCSLRGFVGALRLPEPDMPAFGALCSAEAQQGASQVIGLIYDIAIQDDEFARQIASAEGVSAEQIADHQANRQIPIEFSALAVGYRQGATFHYSLPAQPPLSLAPIYALPATDVVGFTRQLSFLPLILSAGGLPSDELLAAALQGAARARPEAERRAFLVEAGRACSRLLTDDLGRLDNLLQALRPQVSRP